MSGFSCASSLKKFNSTGLWLQLSYAVIKGAGEGFSGFEGQKGQVCSDSTTGGLLLPPPQYLRGWGTDGPGGLNTSQISVARSSSLTSGA